MLTPFHCKLAINEYSFVGLSYCQKSMHVKSLFIYVLSVPMQPYVSTVEIHDLLVGPFIAICHHVTPNAQPKNANHRLLNFKFFRLHPYYMFLNQNLHLDPLAYRIQFYLFFLNENGIFPCNYKSSLSKYRSMEQIERANGN